MKVSSDAKTPYPVQALVPVFLFLIFGIPTAIGLLPVFSVDSAAAKLALAMIAPFTFAVFFLALSAGLSLPFQRAIIAGKFPRSVSHVVYGPRRLYGLCWGAVFYLTPLYFALVSVPTLRKLLLWSFGYRGHPDITIAPDAWIRDLPLLKFGKGAYAANKCSLGSNLCLGDGTVLVDSITLGEYALIGHLAMLAPGCFIGDKCEIGAGAAIGIRARIGKGTRIAPTTTINHGAQIGEGVDIGTMSIVGLKAKIGNGLKIPSGSSIPEGAVFETQEDLDGHARQETQGLREEISMLSRIYAQTATAQSIVAGE